MNKTAESSAVIRFQDCDPFGHLNNSKYIDYMFNAREDQLIHHYDINIFEMAEREKKAWVSGKNEIIYLKPAFVMEKVLIETQLIDYTEKYVQAEMTMYDFHKTHVKSVLWIKFFYFDFKEKKGTDHSGELMETFSALHSPIKAENIDDRAFNIARSLKSAMAAKTI